MTESTVYYGVLMADGIARMFETKEEAFAYCSEQSRKWNTSGLLLTCYSKIDGAITFHHKKDKDAA